MDDPWTIAWLLAKLTVTLSRMLKAERPPFLEQPKGRATTALVPGLLGLGALIVLPGCSTALPIVGLVLAMKETGSPVRRLALVAIIVYSTSLVVNLASAVLLALIGG